MFSSKDRWNRLSSASRGLFCACLSAFVLGAAAPLVLAQEMQVTPPPAQPQTTQAPKATPGAPTAGAPTAGAPGGAAQITEDAWVKLCMRNEQTANKEICLVNHEGLEPNTGMVLIAAAVRKAEGEEKQQLLIRVPTAWSLVIPAGVQLKIDESQPISLQYSICFPTSCQVQMEMTPELFDQMRKGSQMVVAAMNIQQKTMGFPVPLSGFSKAYDGSPVDNVKYEESRRQLMEMFRKRQAELAAKAAEAEQKKGAAQPGQPGQAPAAQVPGQAPANATAQQKQPAPAAPTTP